MPNQPKTYIVHYTMEGADTELWIPVAARDLDEATEWAEKSLEDNGFTVTRIRPKV